MNKLMQLLRQNATEKRSPLAFVRADAASEATLYLYDVIDAYWGVNALDVAQAIQQLSPTDTLHIRINSPGGDVFEGRAIATAIRQFQGKTIAHIDGLAASAATFVLPVVDEVEISDGAFIMIHNGWTLAMGDKRVMLDTHNLLQKIDQSIASDYVKKTGVSEAQITDWMNAETWFTAEESVSHGFADRIASTQDAVTDASRKQFNLQAYDNTPQALLNAPVDETEPVADMADWKERNERRLRLLALNA